MYLMICGEGSTDIGSFDCTTHTFLPSAMYYMIDKLIQSRLKYSLYDTTPENIHYVSRGELSKISKGLVVLRKPKTPYETGVPNKQARALAKLAQDKKKELQTKVIAILFHDTDGTNNSERTLYKDVYNAILDGFKVESFDNGVAMVPKPKSEAWLLYCMDRFLSPIIFKQPNDYENLPGNDNSPNSAKREYAAKLVSLGCQHEVICERINDTFDLMAIDLPSFVDFRTRLFEVLQSS